MVVYEIYIPGARFATPRGDATVGSGRPSGAEGPAGRVLTPVAAPPSPRMRFAVELESNR